MGILRSTLLPRKVFTRNLKSVQSIAENCDDGYARTLDTALPYYTLLLVFSHLWMLYYFPGNPFPGAILSFTLQHIVIFSLALYLDTRIAGITRYLIAGAFLTYVIQMHISTLMIAITGVNISEAWAISTRSSLSSDFIFMIHEAGFSLKSFTGVIIVLVNIFIIGGFTRRFLVTVPLPRWTVMKAVPLIILSALIAFIAEQAISRENPEYFNRREFPSYTELFRQNRYTHTVLLPRELTEPAIEKKLGRIGPPGRPLNIVFFVLESFRWDMIDSTICPNLYDLNSASLSFSNSYCDAIYTALSWHVLFMGRPAYTLSEDMKNEKPPYRGSMVLRILKKAGYSTHLIASANFKWNNFYRRISGDGSLLDSHYFSYDELPEKERNELDGATTERASALLDSLQNKKQPFALFIQLDSTHFTYYFDKDAELFKNYPHTIGFTDVKRRGKINSLFNRYKNAARHVDNKIGIIIRALKKNRLYGNTIIAVVSDHGEGFAPGKIGHHVFHNDIKKLLLMVRLPGSTPRLIDRQISHRDIVPGIFDYLKISGYDPVLLHGLSFLNKKTEKQAVFIVHGSERISELNLIDKSILFRTVITGKSITVTPYGMLDRECRNIDIGTEIARFKWKELLESSLK